MAINLMGEAEDAHFRHEEEKRKKRKIKEKLRREVLDEAILYLAQFSGSMTSDEVGSHLRDLKSRPDTNR